MDLFEEGLQQGYPERFSSHAPGRFCLQLSFPTATGVPMPMWAPPRTFAPKWGAWPFPEWLDLPIGCPFPLEEVAPWHCLCLAGRWGVEHHRLKPGLGC